MSASGSLIQPDSVVVNDSSANASCPSPFDSKEYRIVVAAVSAATSVVSILACVFVILLIVLFKRYMFFTWRLVLYLTIAACVHSIFIVLNRIDYHIRNSGTQNYCIFAGFFGEYTIISQLMAVVCITSNLFVNAILNKRTDRLERLYVVLTFALPLAISLIPFIHHSYGSAGVWCWIRSRSEDNCSIFVYGTILQYTLLYIPVVITLVVIFVIWLLIKCKLARNKRRWAGRYDHQAELVKAQIRREVEPLVWYPLVFIILNLVPLANRIQGAVSPSNPVLGLWVVTAICLPLQGGLFALTFTLHPSNLRSLRWRELKAAVAVWRYSREAVVQEYAVEITEDFRETEAVDMHNHRYTGFDKYNVS